MCTFQGLDSPAAMLYVNCVAEGALLWIGPVDVSRSYWRGQSILDVEVEALMRVESAYRKAVEVSLKEAGKYNCHVKVVGLMISDHVVEEGLEACDW